MKVSAKYQTRTCEVDVPFSLSLEDVISRIGETQALACFEYAITGKAQQELRRLMRLNRSDEEIRERMQTWTPFPRANRSLAMRLMKEALDD